MAQEVLDQEVQVVLEAEAAQAEEAYLEEQVEQVVQEE